jgi:AmmeMemoRadiSam system protein B
MPQIRPAAVAGAFYPGQPYVLAQEVESMLQQAASNPSPTSAHPPKALIVPHAGYVYSGPVAAQAYAQLLPWRDQIQRVVLLGPVHRVPVRGIAWPGVEAFATPLGTVPIDRAALAAIADLPQVVQSPAAHAWEHSLEVQLPFLQAVLDRFSLVPLAVGDASAEEVAEVLERLWGGPETLIVVSSDLSHYHPYGEARRLDAESVQTMLELRPVLDHEQACGATPVNGLLLAARRHGLHPHLLDLRNSGDTAGDRSRVVGYAALSFTEPSHVAPGHA